MKRKLVSVLLSAAMLATALAGCGSSGSTSTSASAESTVVQEAASSEAEAASTEAAAATEASTEASTETAAGESTASTEYNPSGELNLIHYLTETAKLQALDDLVAGFQEEYPDVTVNVEAMSMDNYTDVIKLRFSTDEAPDIIFGQPKSYSDLVENGLIKDLSGYDFVSRMTDSSQECVTVDGKQYGVALDQMCNVVFYNKDIFEELGLSIPTTYSEFISTCQALEDAEITACAAGYTDDIGIGANWYTIYYGSKWNQAPDNAQELMDGASFGDYPGYTEALEQWREIMVNYQNDDYKTIDTARAEQLFATGETGMIIIGTWGLGAILDFNPEGNFGGFTYPSEENADDVYIPVNIDDCWMVSESTDNEEAALAFLEYASRSDVNAEWCGTTAQLSALEGVPTDKLPAAAQDIANEVATKKNAAWASLSTFVGQYSTVYYNVLRDFALDDEMTAEELIQAMDDGFATARK